MKTKRIGQAYNTCLETSDWRYSAAILGLVKYFEAQHISYQIQGDCLYYNEEDITEENYLLFAESYYGDKFHHIVIENMLKQATFLDEEIKLVNEKLKGNTIMKNIMKKVTFDGYNNEEILRLIGVHRLEIVKETFRNKNDMYKNYSNPNALLSSTNETCRLIGYNIDFAKKGKSASYNFDKANYRGEDIREFDFIPFGFVGGRETFFINDNISIKTLRSTYETYRNLIELDKDQEQKDNSRKVLFKAIIEMEDFINYDTEIMTKKQTNDYFETMYIRKQNLKVLKAINSFYQVFCFSIKVNDNYWINVQEYVVNCILNNLRTDDLIERMLKEGQGGYAVDRLITLNRLIEGRGVEMEKRTKAAYACAKEVITKLPENKLSSYRQKLTSAIVFNDYDRVCEILLQLSNYADVSFDFAYDLFEDFEANKDIAYSFVNALSSKQVKREEGDVRNNG